MVINLGDEVEDVISGFRGVATSRHVFLYGETSVTVQPVIGEYGILPECEIFAESQLKVTKALRKKPIVVK